MRARDEHNYLALTQLLVVAGTPAESTNPAEAIENLKEANEVSQEKNFHHVFAWSAFELAQVYRDSGKLDDAEALASKAIQVMRDREARCHLPIFDPPRRLGSYSEATDVIDALLVNVTRRQLKSSLIATLSDAYIGHFELTATKFADPAKGYEIIQRARGRNSDIHTTMRYAHFASKHATRSIIEAQRIEAGRWSQAQQETFRGRLF